MVHFELCNETAVKMTFVVFEINLLSVNPTKWSSKIKQLVGNSGQIV